MTQSMTREAALRIGLAARELNLPEVAGLVRALAGKLDLPLTEAKLAGVTVTDLPPLDACGEEGDMPYSIRVAVASNRGGNLDGHFGSCERFLIYQVSSDDMHLLDARPALEADHAEDRNAARAQLIADCQIVYLASIGGPAAAKVVRAGVHPVRIPKAGPARETLARLQEALRSPPPWLAKAMGVKAASLERFFEEAEG